MKPCILFLLLAQAGGEVTVSGRIMDSIRHQPVAGARVQTCCPDTAVTSAADGTYTLRFVPDQGRVGRMLISKDGYSDLVPPVTYRGGDIGLIPPATISGRLVDRDSGKPLEGFLVEAQHAPFSRLAQQPVGADGWFTITRLAPSDYLLKVSSPQRAKITFGEPKPDTKEEDIGYGATWFPGVPRAEMAAAITVSPGEEREVEVRLEKRKRLHIAGVFELPEDHEGHTVLLSIASTGHPLQPLVESNIPDDGAFRIEGLDEGSYQLTAWSKGAGTAKLCADRQIDLTDRNIEDLKLTMRHTVSIRAVVAMAEDKVLQPSGIVFAPLSVITGIAQSHSDSLYTDGLPPGEYWLATIVPAGYAVSAMNYNGRAVVNATVDIESPESVVNLVVTSRPAALSGFVRDADQNPLSDVAVLLLPEPTPEKLSPYSQGRDLAVSDANGAFRLSNLAPGRYRAIALTGKDREHFRNIDFLRVRAASADSVTLDFGQIANLDLHVK